MGREELFAGAALMPAQYVMVNPQANFVVITGISDAALGLRPALLDILFRHEGNSGLVDGF